MRDLLRRAGFDIDAKVAALKVELEAKAQHLADKAKGEAKRLAVGSALWAAAGVMGFLLLLVALTAIYLAVEIEQGPFVALGAVALALILLALALAFAARNVMRSPPRDRHILFPPPTPRAPAPPEAAVVEPVYSAVSPRTAIRDILFPVLGLVSRFRPLTGHWGVDGLIRHAGSRTERTAQQAVVQAADLVQTGSRGTLVGVLAVAGFVGWLMVRRKR